MFSRGKKGLFFVFHHPCCSLAAIKGSHNRGAPSEILWENSLKQKGGRICFSRKGGSVLSIVWQEKCLKRNTVSSKKRHFFHSWIFAYIAKSINRVPFNSHAMGSPFALFSKGGAVGGGKNFLSLLLMYIFLFLKEASGWREGENAFLKPWGEK